MGGCNTPCHSVKALPPGEGSIFCNQPSRSRFACRLPPRGRLDCNTWVRSGGKELCQDIGEGAGGDGSLHQEAEDGEGLEAVRTENVEAAGAEAFKLHRVQGAGACGVGRVHPPQAAGHGAVGGDVVTGLSKQTQGQLRDGRVGVRRFIGFPLGGSSVRAHVVSPWFPQRMRSLDLHPPHYSTDEKKRCSAKPAEFG